MTKTPLRVSFVGGGTDIESYYKKNGGAVISTAIQKHIYILVNKRFEESIRVSYSKTEIVDSVDKIEHNIVRESMKKMGLSKGIEIVSIADIPSRGTGLGSSSAFTVGLLNGLYAYTGKTSSSKILAEDACDLEINIPHLKSKFSGAMFFGS
jgi:D-glycero-alpha-D-manno-heptose-7-phosphate kinase